MRFEPVWFAPFTLGVPPSGPGVAMLVFWSMYQSKEKAFVSRPVVNCFATFCCGLNRLRLRETAVDSVFESTIIVRSSSGGEAALSRAVFAARNVLFVEIAVPGTPTMLGLERARANRSVSTAFAMLIAAGLR